MIVNYSAQARADLDGIANYLILRNPAAALRVSNAIRTVIDDLVRHPKRGRRQDSPGVRKLVEPRYGYLIYYHLDEAGSVVTILAVRHHAQDRLFDD